MKQPSQFDDEAGRAMIERWVRGSVEGWRSELLVGQLEGYGS